MLAAALALLLSAAPDAALPAAAPPLPRLHLALDAGVTALLGASWLALDLNEAALARPSCPCRREEVLGFERFAVDQHLRHGEAAAGAALALSLAATTSLTAIAASNRTEFIDAFGLAAESAVAAGFAGEVVKIAVSRPYPYMYRPAPYPQQNVDGVNYASFWSGHTAVPMAAAVSAALVLQLRGAPKPLRLLAWTVPPALALVAGALQMTASNHFPTDVLAGAAAGAGLGAANVFLHRF